MKILQMSAWCVCVCSAADAFTPSTSSQKHLKLEISVWKIDRFLLTKSQWSIIISCLAPSSCCTIVIFLM